MSHYIFLYASVFLVSRLNVLSISTVSLWASSLGHVGSWTKKEEKLLLCISLWLYHPYRHSHHIIIRELTKKRFWATTSTCRKWTFYIPEQWFCQHSQLHHLYKCKETRQYKFYSVKVYFKKGRNPHFRLTCASQKRLCVSSVLCH